MKKLILIGLVLFYPNFAYAFIDKSELDLKVKELIKGNSHKWIILDGAGVGIVLNSSKESENIIDSHFNKLTNANGQIVSPDSKCKGKLSYFSGSLLDLETPKSPCGFGHVIKHKEASTLLQKLSDILLLQEKIRLELHGQKTDIDSLKKEIFKSIKELSSLVKEIKASKFEKINHGKEGIVLELNNAISANLASIEKLNKVQKNTSNTSLIKESFKKLSEAYDSEVRTIDKVIKAEKYL